MVDLVVLYGWKYTPTEFIVVVVVVVVYGWK